jgi:(R,R)-butanediol dehydrogenase/meso-butanediol dehydrogenase/diacetyl reductase
MMKAAVYYGPGDIRFEERPIPVPAVNQLVVQVDYVGICGTDVHSYHTEGMVAPVRVLGHETVGTVTAVGAGVEGITVGEQLLCGPPTQCKEYCAVCRTGATNICVNAMARTAGIGDVDGSYAEYLLVPDVKHTTLLKVPPGVDPKEAVLFDVACVALHAIRKSRFRVGDNVVVSGAGPIGLSTVALLKFAGASKIIVLETSEDKHALARALGGDYVFNPAGMTDLAGEIGAIIGSGVAADVVFDCVGSARSLQTCVEAGVRPGGQIMLIGAGTESIDFCTARLVVTEIDLQSSFVYTSDEVITFLDLIASGRLSFKSLVTDVIRLEDCVEQGLERLRRPGSGQVKILISPLAQGR